MAMAMCLCRLLLIGVRSWITHLRWTVRAVQEPGHLLLNATIAIVAPCNEICSETLSESNSVLNEQGTAARLIEVSM